MRPRCEISVSCVLNVCLSNKECVVKKCSIETKKELKDIVEGREKIRLVGYTSDSVSDIKPATAKPKKVIKEKLPIHNVRFFTKDSQCYYCKVSLTHQNRTRDHLHPKSKGGKLNHVNKIFACRACNSEKSDSSIGEWLVKLINSENQNARTETIITTIQKMLPKLKAYEKGI